LAVHRKRHDRDPDQSGFGIGHLDDETVTIAGPAPALNHDDFEL
jgi:hypothetical protein